jgi:hypothetical protein
MLTAKTTTSSTGSKDFDKQTTFAIYSALTMTAKEIQAETIKGLDKTSGGAFDIRTNWNKPSNIFGVRVKPATKQKLEAWIGTAAEWLEKFVREPQGSIVLKLPRGEFIAIPTSNVRRTKRDLIRATQRPQAIRGKRDILLPMKSGRGFVLFQEQGRGVNAKRVALYVLVRRAQIHERDVLYGPAKRVFQKRFPVNLERQLKVAFAPRKSAGSGQ